MLKYGAVLLVLLAGCEGAEARCERLGLDIRLANLAEKHADEDYRDALYWVTKYGYSDSGRAWQGRADSIMREYGTRTKVKMTDRSWYRRHCQ